jgi:hypothetical protein
MLASSHGRASIWISIYLPDTSKSEECFVDVLARLDAMLTDWSSRLPRPARIVLAGDVNTRVQSDGIIIGPSANACGSCADVARAAHLIDFTAKWSLAWSSTWILPLGSWTIENKSSKSHYMLDYVLMNGFDCSAMSVKYGFDFASDHCCIEFCVRLPEKLRSLKRAPQHRPHIDWASPHVQEHLKLVGRGLAESDTLQDIQSKLEGETRFLETIRGRHRGPRSPPVELANMYSALEESDDPAEQQALGKAIYRYKRDRADSARTAAFNGSIDKRLVLKPKQNKRMQKDSLFCNGTPTADRELWAHEISGFYAGLYCDTSIVSTEDGQN